MSAQTNPKKLILTILDGNILVYEDDTITQVTGKVIAGWYDRRVLGEDKWMVSIGPTLNTTLDPNDIGANSWWAENIILIDIWVPILESTPAAPLGYTPERMRFSLKEAVKQLLQAQLVNPASDVKYLRVMGWQDLDDRENDILRVQFTVSVEWEE